MIVKKLNKLLNIAYVSWSFLKYMCITSLYINLKARQFTSIIKKNYKFKR